MNNTSTSSSSSTIHYHPKNKIKFTPFGSSLGNSSFNDEDDSNSKQINTIQDKKKNNKLNFSDDDYNNNEIHVEYVNQEYNEEEDDEYNNLIEFDDGSRSSSKSSSTNSLSTMDSNNSKTIIINTTTTTTITTNSNNSISIQSSSSSSSSDSNSRVTFTLTFIFLLIVIFACIFYFSKNLVSFLEFVKELGILGNVILAVAFLPTGIPLAIFSIYIPLTLSAGFIYGFVPGFITVSIGSAVSASFGFWVTRKVSLKWFESKIESSPKLSALRNRVEQHPFKIIIIMRLLPIPFGLQNGLCAMTRISYTKFIYSTVIGLTFENLLLSYLGSTIKTITEITNGHQNAFSSYQQTLIAIAIVFAIVLTFIGKRILSNASSTPLPITISSTDNNNNNNNDKQIENTTDNKDIILVIKSSVSPPTSSSSSLSNDVISSSSSSSTPNNSNIISNGNTNDNNNIHINSPFNSLHKTRKD